MQICSREIRFIGKCTGSLSVYNLKQMNLSIKIRELVLDMIKLKNKALLKETLIKDDLEQN